MSVHMSVRTYVCPYVHNEMWCLLRSMRHSWRYDFQGHLRSGSTSGDDLSPLLGYFVFSVFLSISIASVSANGVDLSSRPSICRSVCASVCPESVLWRNSWLDPDAIWDGEWGWPRHWCIRWGRRAAREGRFQEFFVPKPPSWFQWHTFAQKCVRLVHERLKYFHMHNISLESTFHWLSKDTVEFEVNVGVCEKFAKV